MKRMGIIVFVFSLSTSALPGQNPGQQRGSGVVGGIEPFQASGHDKSPTIIVGAPSVAACPVVMHAGHLADGSFVKTDGAHPRGIGQWLSLSLTSRQAKTIAKATLVVHGLTPQGHLTQALAEKGGPGDAERTFHVSFSPGANEISQANLWVQGMSAVERIDLLEIGYDDGTAWTAAAGHSCRVEPDLKMLISNR